MAKKYSLRPAPSADKIQAYKAEVEREKAAQQFGLTAKEIARLDLAVKAFDRYCLSSISKKSVFVK